MCFIIIEISGYTFRHLFSVGISIFSSALSKIVLSFLNFGRCWWDVIVWWDWWSFPCPSVTGLLFCCQISTRDENRSYSHKLTRNTKRGHWMEASTCFLFMLRRWFCSSFLTICDLRLAFSLLGTSFRVKKPCIII